MKIRPLALQDAAAMYALEQTATHYPMSQAMLDSCFGPLYYVVGAFEGEQLIGFIIIHQILEEATVMDICVGDAYQRQGVGISLMTHAIDDLTSNGAEVLMLEVRSSNKKAIGLYQKMEFALVGSRKNYYRTASGAEDAQLMSLILGGNIS